MLTRNLTLLQNVPNVVTMSQYDVDKYKNMASKPPKLPNMNTSQFKLPKY